MNAADQIASMFRGVPRVRSAAELAPRDSAAQIARALELEAGRCLGRCIRSGGMLCSCATVRPVGPR